MKDLVIFSKSQITYNPNILNIESFEKLHKDNTKERFLKLLSFVFFYLDYRSPFVSYVEEVRVKKIEERLNIKVTLKDLKACLSDYADMQDSISFRLLRNCHNLINKSMAFYDSVDYMLLDQKGEFIYNINHINKSLKETREMLNNLKQLEEDVKRDNSLNTRIIGQGKIGNREA